MPQDGILFRALSRELSEVLVGARVDKAMQPERDEIHLILRSKGENLRLVLSASANHARVHISAASKPNPPTPPMFCMLLRKHIVGGHVKRVEQNGLDRAIDIDIEAQDELGLDALYTLTAEVMGRHSNIILVKDGRVLDSVKRIPSHISSVREVLPGVPFERPPAQNKLNFLSASGEEVARALWEHREKSTEKALLNALLGIGPVTAREIALSAGIDFDVMLGSLPSEKLMGLYREIAALSQRIERPIPALSLDSDGKPVDVLPFSYHIYSHMDIKPYPSLSEALDGFFLIRDARERMSQRGRTLNRNISNLLDKARNRLAQDRQTILEAQNMESMRVMGELLTANLYAVQRGARSITVDDYYNPGQSLEIPLDVKLTPAQNAQKYFKRYSKLHAGVKRAQEQIGITLSQIAYLEGQLDNMEKCTTETELAEIRDELAREGYLKPEPKSKTKKRQQTASTCLAFMLDGGARAFVGKNNAQNERLTLREAAPDDIWLHIKDAPGSHVLIKSADVSEQAMMEAAMLAAFYSSKRAGENVAVDYTRRRYVKKMPGVAPGMVIYTNQKTLFVTPSEVEVAKLEQVNPA